MRSVIMVCSGNTCRSPMAEALLRRMLPGVDVSSAGLYAMNGMPASDGAQREMARRGLSLANHRSRQLTREMARGARRLLGADIAVSVTGLAGPDGDGTGRPVGLVYIALDRAAGCLVQELHLAGDRAAVRGAAAQAIFALLLEALSNSEECL